MSSGTVGAGAVPLGTFVVGDQTFVGARGRVAFRRDFDGDPWRVDLVIEAEPRGGDEDAPSLRIARLTLDVADWTDLVGQAADIRDPEGDEGHDQNLFWGPHFENLVNVTLRLGHVRGGEVTVTVTATALRRIEGTNDDESFAVAVCAPCDLPRAPASTTDPPMGRKVCRSCGGVSFDQVPQCPSCKAPGWWNG
jgi:hypothetical protein